MFVYIYEKLNKTAEIICISVFCSANIDVALISIYWFKIFIEKLLLHQEFSRIVTMGDYPDPDEEYELMYADELEMLQEEDDQNGKYSIPYTVTVF